MDFKQLFQGYDVRGIYGRDLDEQAAAAIGRGYAEFLQQKGLAEKVLAARDNRSSSPALQKRFVDGLLKGGCTVIDLGEATTGIVHWALKKLGAGGGAMVTASHNPPEYNGMKMYNRGFPLSKEEMAEVRLFAEKSDELKDRHGGSLEQKSVAREYLEENAAKNRLEKKIKVVLDCANGVSGLFAPELFRKMGCEVAELYCIPDSSFPNHEPNPTNEETLAALKRKVVDEKADLGIAFDGDADRVVFVDENGETVKGDFAFMLFAENALEENPRGLVAYDLRLSLAVREEIERLGGKAVMTKSGRIAVREEMRKNGGCFGGETSGHFFFGEIGGYDDALYAGAKMARILAESGKKMSQLAAALPHYFATPEYRPHCDDSKKRIVVEELAKELAAEGIATSLLDGVRAEWKDGWGLVRVSNTEPALSMRMEARSEKKLEEIYELFGSKLAKRGVELPPLKH